MAVEKQPIIGSNHVTGPNPTPTRPISKKPIVNNNVGYKKPEQNKGKLS